MCEYVNVEHQKSWQPHKKTLLNDLMPYNIMFLKFLCKNFIMFLNYRRFSEITSFCLIIHVTFRRQVEFSDFSLKIYFRHHIWVFNANSEYLMEQFRIFTKSMPFFQQNDEILVFWRHFWRNVTYDAVPTTFFASHIWQFPKYSENFIV